LVADNQAVIAKTSTNVMYTHTHTVCKEHDFKIFTAEAKVMYRTPIGY